MKEIEYEPHYSKENYVAVGFEEVKIGISPEHSHSVTNDMFAKRKQYGLRHHVVMTVHAAMGDTLKTMVTRISTTDNNFAMWDKGQLIVILSRTKEANKSIFVGPKNDTLAAFRQLVLRKTQWSLHMEKVLNLITVNADNGNEARVINMESFPYVIRNIVFMQLTAFSSIIFWSSLFATWNWYFALIPCTTLDNTCANNDCDPDSLVGWKSERSIKFYQLFLLQPRTMKVMLVWS